MITLSYSTLKMLHDSSHQWVNRMLEIPRPPISWLEAGKEAHKAIQGHVSGKLKDLRLASLDGMSFPVVEEKDFDERCKFYLEWSVKYRVIGFVDGMDPEHKVLLEIKTGRQPWSLSKFHLSMQRKMYALGMPEYKIMTLVTCRPDLTELKIYNHSQDDKDRDEAKGYITEGIQILESGKFTGGLDENGKCVDRMCLWQDKCHFR